MWIRNIIKDKTFHDIMIRGSTHQGDITTYRFMNPIIVIFWQQKYYYWNLDLNSKEIRKDNLQSKKDNSSVKCSHSLVMKEI